MCIEDVENRWSRELQADVEIDITREGRYAVYIDRNHWDSYTSLGDLEHGLSRLYMLTEDPPE